MKEIIYLIQLNFYYYNNINENEEEKEGHFIIIGNKEIFSNMKNNVINQYFMDCTYSAVPPSIYKYKLMVIYRCNPAIDKTVLCCFILLCKENETTFTEIFKYLYKKYNFNPHNIIVDYNLAQIKGLNNIYGIIYQYMDSFSIFLR